MVFKVKVHIPTEQPAALLQGVSISPNGKFVVVSASSGASSRRMYRWDEATETYVRIPEPTNLISRYSSWTKDSGRLLCQNSAGVLTLYDVDPDTGALTDYGLTSGTGIPDTTAMRFWMSDTILVSLVTGNSRFVYVHELVGPDLILRNTYTAVATAGALPFASFYGPLPNTLHRVCSNGYTQLLQIDLETFEIDMLTEIREPEGGNFPNTTRVGAATINGAKTIIGVTAPNTDPGYPHVKFLCYDIDAGVYFWMPWGTSDANAFPRPGLDLTAWPDPLFVSRDGAFMPLPRTTGEPEYGVQFADDGSYVTGLPPGTVPVITPGVGSNTLATTRLNAASADGTAVVFGANAAPFLRIFREVEPDALIVSGGIMGQADINSLSDERATFAAVGIMGAAALEASVATNAIFAPRGLMGSSDMVAGQDTSGPDTIPIILSRIPLALDGMNVAYTAEFVGLHATLDAMGPMGDAVVKLSIGPYSFLDGVGIMGSADLEASYDTAQIELDARGLMGVATIELDLPIGARFFVDGIMGRADIAFTVPLGAFLSGAGPMGDAEVRALIALEGSIDAVGPMGNASIFGVGEEDGLLQAVGIMGSADLVLDYWAGPLDVVGIMGGATVLLRRSGELATFAARGPMGQAAIHIEEVAPRTGEINARGLMGVADIMASIPDYAALFANGIMGLADIEAEANILARFEVMGIMGQAEFINLPGKRADIRALGLMGRAELQGDVQSYGDIRAVGLMGIATLETRARTRRKTFFVKKPF